MSRGILTTTLLWHDSRGGEVETKVRVVYNYSHGFPATYDDPGEPCEVEIISITPVPNDPDLVVPSRFETDEDLLNECVSDALDERENAREWRAQCRRDDALMDRRS